jgi:hypothetical protein
LQTLTATAAKLFRHSANYLPGKDMIQMAVLSSFRPKLNRSKLASVHRSLIVLFGKLQFAI